jgi:RND superfamily putative drug exporter
MTSTRDGPSAVTDDLGRTGRLVTSAAAILMLSFLSMSSGPQTDLKILATGLGAGILVDALVVRCLLVPAMVALFGRANWWLPGWLGRALRISGPAVAGPAVAAAGTVPAASAQSLVPVRGLTGT